MQITARKLIPALVVIAVAAGRFSGWRMIANRGPGAGFVNGNGRIEATEIDIATKLPGRVKDVLVREGDFVSAGQTLAHRQIDTLQAQRSEAQAQHQQAINTEASAKAQIAQRESELDAARRRLARPEKLSKEGASSMQELDDDRARVKSAQAAVSAARAQVTAAAATVTATRAQQTGAQSAIAAAQATVDRVQADIIDSDLKAPRAGRVQFRVAQPGEVLAAGGRVLNMVDLSDVYMTFFLPTQAAGLAVIGSALFAFSLVRFRKTLSQMA